MTVYQDLFESFEKKPEQQEGDGSAGGSAAAAPNRGKVRPPNKSQTKLSMRKCGGSYCAVCAELWPLVAEVASIPTMQSTTQFLSSCCLRLLRCRARWRNEIFVTAPA